MSSPSNAGNTPKIPAPPIWRDSGVLLFGLLMLALGILGWVTGRALIVLPGSSQVPIAWTVAAPGGRVAATGVFVVGIACVGYWHTYEKRRWPIRIGLVGLALVGVGHFLAWIGSRV